MQGYLWAYTRTTSLLNSLDKSAGVDVPEGYCIKLKKDLYGTKQAAFLWNGAFVRLLLSEPTRMMTLSLMSTQTLPTLMLMVSSREQGTFSSGVVDPLFGFRLFNPWSHSRHARVN